MNLNNQLTTPEKLVAFVDGELDPNQTGNLFYELAQNSELQDEMRQLLKMKSFFSNSHEIPPDNLKSKILTAAGLAAAPTALASLGNSTNLLSGGLLGILKTKGFLVFASTLAGIASTVLYMNFVGIGPVNKPAGTVSSKAFMNMFSAEPDYSMYYAGNHPAVQTERKVLNSKIPRIINTEANVSPSALEIVPEEESKSPDIILFTSNGRDDNISQFHYEKNINMAYANPVKQYNKIKQVTDSKSFSLQLRHFYARSIPEVDVPALSNPVINNVGFSLMYRLDPTNSFGIECGQENIHQIFDESDKDHTINYQQNYLAFWGGGVYQYSGGSLDNLSDVKPYIRLLIGGTSIGPIGKLGLGLNYLYMDKLIFNFGLEGTLLYYQFQGRSYTTEKVGITYGIAVKL